MSISLAMIVRDEAETLPRTLPTYLPLIDSWTVVDTGSTDGTPDLVEELLGHIPGRLYAEKWPTGPDFDYGKARTHAVELARRSTDWTLMPDADMECELHPNLRSWFVQDPDPRVDVWVVPVTENRHVWKWPRLMRNTQGWTFVGKRHEYLDTSGKACREILGLTLNHSRPGPSNGKYDEYAEALRADAETGEPRWVFYYAESLRFAGRTDEAVEWYKRRMEITTGFDEERWYSAYMVGRLTDDVEALVACWESRPWRHEPLTAAARITARRGARSDMLFLEPGP